MIPFASTTVTITRPTGGAVAEGGMVDPWDATETTSTEAPGTTVASGVRAVFAKPTTTMAQDGATRASTRWQVLLDPCDAQDGDTLHDETTGVAWPVNGVEQRQVGLSVDHTVVWTDVVVGEV